jgi:nitroimidazol reductase NimA-like FMN-containing flavoprotein (pyridoxamine 5'-phosphate oxidase superfamily)
MKLGPLDREQIDDVIRSQVIGRIGCHADGRTYIVPIAYAYDGDAVYVHSFEGMKLAMMRKNPQVCVEIEDLRGPTEWRTVVAWGRFEELSGPAADRALGLIMARCPPPSHEGTIFRVLLDERTGRFAA